MQTSTRHFELPAALPSIKSAPWMFGLLRGSPLARALKVLRVLRIKPACLTGIVLVLMAFSKVTLADGNSSAEITDYVRELGIRAVADEYATPSGVALCVQGADHLWFLWYPSRPSDHAPGAAQCPVQHDWKPISNDLIGYGPPYDTVAGASHGTFAGAKAIRFHPGGSSLCSVLYPTYYTVEYQGGAIESFRVLQRLKKASVFELGPSCDDVHGRSVKFPMQYDEVGPLFSRDIGNGTSLIYVPLDHPLLLLIKKLPKTVWTNGKVFVMSAETFDATTTGITSGPYARYQALAAVLSKSNFEDSPSTATGKLQRKE
jgi:hypothetical protein